VTLNRKGHTNAAATTFGVMDNLTYTYANNNTSNKLVQVTDAIIGTAGEGGFKDGNKTGNDYTYDVNGNMTKDDNKGITNITYNHLNLPTQVTMTSGTISYIYDATGVKQRKTVSTGATTDYASNFVYENNTLQFFNQPEGYVEPTSDVNKPFQYVYQYKDHLGNIRLSYKDISTASTPILQIQEENNYYPFGLKHKGYNNVQVGRDHKFGFGNKEEQDELGLAWIDITARNYDATLGRWMNVDPLADERPWESPYAYCGNDPINRIDEDGEFWVQLGGAILSAGIDYAGQVAGNLATGQGMRSALTSNISIGSILVSATEGAINPIGGVSKATTKSFAITIAKTTIKEAGKSGAGQVIDNIIDIAQGKDTKISNGVVREAVVGGIVGNAKIAPNSPKANKTIIELNIKQDKGKTLTKRQTERLVDAKTEKSSNDIVNGTMNYVGTANQKAVSNVIKEGNEKKD